MCLTLIYVGDVTKGILAALYIPSVVCNLVVWPLVLMLYVENILRQVIYISWIVENALVVETEVNKETSYYVYSLKDKKLESASVFDQINFALRALLFSLILLLQTVVIDVLYVAVPISPIFHVDNFFYSVYLSVGFLALKIPYQDHLPYYFHSNIAYLGGYSMLLTYILNSYFAFPYLGVLLSILTPFFVLAAFYTDPPDTTAYHLRSFQQSNPSHSYFQTSSTYSPSRRPDSGTPTRTTS